MANPDDPDAGELAGYDLRAWQAPAPPAGLTDSVLARMQAPLAVKPSDRSRSARTISAVAGATLVAAAAVAALMMTHHEVAPIVAAQQAKAAPGVPAPTSPTPTPSPRAMDAVGGSPEDDARVHALEKRVLELEVTVEEMRTQLADLRAPRTVHPGPSPRPPIVVPSDPDTLMFLPTEPAPTPCDPFLHPHGCSLPFLPMTPSPPTPVASCDADALVAAGTTAMDNGDYAGALRSYEAALACKPDGVHVLKLSYMAACRVRDVAKARGYFARLDTASQQQLAAICVREGIEPQPADTTPGTLQIASEPPAKIFFDGNDTGKVTPAKLLGIAPGTHKITLGVDGNKYTWPVTVHPGETVTLDKDLR